MPDTIAQVANACEVAKKTIKSLFEQAAPIAVSKQDVSLSSFSGRNKTHHW